MRILKSAGVGLLLGAGWGVLARVWMHFLTDDPHFSWAGSLLIVALASMTGLLLGVVHGARVAGRTRWWRLAAVPTVLIFGSPGFVWFPTYIAGGFALSEQGPRWLRALLGVVVVGWTGVVQVMVITSDGTPGVVIPTLGWLAGSLTMALAGREIFRRWRPARIAVAVAPAPVAA